MSLEKPQDSSPGLLLQIFAVLFVAPWEGGKWLYKRIYEPVFSGKYWSDAFVYSLLALVGTVYSAQWIFNFLHHHGHGWFVSLAAGFVTTLVSGGYACPILWLGFLKFFWHRTEDGWKAINNYGQTHFENEALETVHDFRWLPFSKSLWDKLLDPTRKSWFAEGVRGLMYPIVVIGSGWVGYNKIYLFSHALAQGTLGLAASVAGAVVGFMVAALLVDLLCKFIAYGKIPAVAILLSGAAAVAAGHFAYHWGAIAFGITFAVVGTLSVGIILPGVFLLFSDRLLKWVINTFVPWLHGAYSQPTNPARRFEGQVRNLGVTALAGWGTWLLCGAIATPIWVTVPAIALAVYLFYTVGGQLWDSDEGSYACGSILALVAGACGGYEYHRLGLPLGGFGIGAAGVLSAFLVFGLIYPVVLRSWQRVATRTWLSAIVNPVSGWLVTWHDAVWTPFEKLVEKCGTVYYSGYRDDGDFSKLVLQLFNGFVALAVPVVFYFGLHQFVVAHLILSSIAVLLLTAFSYVVGGHYILRTGVELVGAVVALAVTILAAVFVGPAQALGMAFAVPFGIVLGFLTFWLAFPALFVGFRYVSEPHVTNFLLPLVAGLYNRAWARFGKWWVAFQSAYVAVVNFLKPYWLKFTTSCKNAWNSVVAAWNKVRGR